MSYIEIKGFDYIALEELTISKKISSHSTADLKCSISSEDCENIFELIDNEVVIYEKDEDKTLELFIGYIENIRLIHQYDNNLCDISLKSYSCKADYETEKKIFQEKNQDLKSIVTPLLKKYKSLVNFCDDFPKFEHIILKYNETDWKFIVRLAGMFNAPVVFDNRCKYYWIG